MSLSATGSRNAPNLDDRFWGVGGGAHGKVGFKTKHQGPTKQQIWMIGSGELGEVRMQRWSMSQGVCGKGRVGLLRWGARARKCVRVCSWVGEREGEREVVSEGDYARQQLLLGSKVRTPAISRGEAGSWGRSSSWAGKHVTTHHFPCKVSIQPVC